MGCPRCQGERSRAGLQHLLTQAMVHVHKFPSCDGLLGVVASGLLSWVELGGACTIVQKAPARTMEWQSIRVQCGRLMTSHTEVADLLN